MANDVYIYIGRSDAPPTRIEASWWMADHLAAVAGPIAWKRSSTSSSSYADFEAHLSFDQLLTLHAHFRPHLTERIKWLERLADSEQGDADDRERLAALKRDAELLDALASQGVAGGELMIKTVEWQSGY